jgi:hypothetical protein
MANVYFGEGRIASEKNDCTVIALSYACGISYEDAHNICKTHGRKDKKGFALGNIFHTCIDNRRVKLKLAGNKYEITYYPRPHMNIKSFKKFRNFGNFICVRSGHAFCVKDGIVYNQRNEKQLVKYFWEIKKC